MVRVLLPAPRKLAPAPPAGAAGHGYRDYGGCGNTSSGSSNASVHYTPSTSSTSPESSVSPTRRQEVKKERKRRGKFKSEQLRKETCMTRTTGACIRCQKNKIRCMPGPDPSSWCMNCLALSSRVLRMPCFRARVTEADLFRRGPTSDFAWTRRWILLTSIKEIDTWSSPAHRSVEMTQDMGKILELRCKEYIPLEGDKQQYSWPDPITGQNKTLRTPPFAIADVEHAQATIEKYIDQNLETYLEGLLDSENTIIWESFRIALSMAGPVNMNGSVMLRRALKLWVGSRLIEQPWRICGQETLGMNVCTDPTSPYHGRIPVTPIMDFQLDNITIHYLLMPWKAKLLKELQKKILGNRKEDWLEIHLTMFVLLNNVERQVKHDNWFARRYGMKNRFSNYGLIDAIFAGAKILLAHFHHVNKGHMPFSLTWEGNQGYGSPSSSSGSERSSASPTISYNRSGIPTSDASTSPPKSPIQSLSPDQIKYMLSVTTAARAQEPKLRSIQENRMYEEPMFWCSQLFLPGWTPPATPSPDDPYFGSPSDSTVNTTSFEAAANIPDIQTYEMNRLNEMNSLQVVPFSMATSHEMVPMTASTDLGHMDLTTVAPPSHDPLLDVGYGYHLYPSPEVPMPMTMMNWGLDL
ncbi:hypothetical protein DFH27DRAFT_526931 [Peziza echinospora]|nr:hypothetical protein DFH27DRAFT_526931 [Peziza echinospora]